MLLLPWLLLVAAASGILIGYFRSGHGEAPDLEAGLAQGAELEAKAHDGPQVEAGY